MKGKICSLLRADEAGRCSIQCVVVVFKVAWRQSIQSKGCCIDPRTIAHLNSKHQHMNCACSSYIWNPKEPGVLTKEALNVGTVTPRDAVWVLDSTFIAPGGRLVVIYMLQIKTARRTSTGAFLKTERRNINNGEDRTENRASIVETRSVDLRNMCQRYWTKTVPRDTCKHSWNPKASMFEAVET